MRNHSVQYTSEPDFGWEKLRRAWPSVYESHEELQTETWMKVKIEVMGRSAKLYINGSEQPSLIVGAEARDCSDVETGECTPEVLPLAQDRQPRQPRLESL